MFQWIQTISNIIVNTSSWAAKGQPPPEPKPIDVSFIFFTFLALKSIAPKSSK